MSREPLQPEYAKPNEKLLPETRILICIGVGIIISILVWIILVLIYQNTGTGLAPQ
jgi:hypothetical protein